MLSEREHLSPYRGIDSYTIDSKDAPVPTSYTRLYRVESSLPIVVAGLEQVAGGTGWELVGASCPAAFPFDITRQYQRRVAGFRATAAISWATTQSTVFPGTAMSNLQVRLEAPSVYSADPLGSLSPKAACLTPPPSAPLPPPPPGACPAADALVGVVIPQAATELVSQPMRELDRDIVRPRWIPPPAGEPEARHSASEPLALLLEHGALEGWAANDDRTRSERSGPDVHAAAYAFEFPSHDAARAFHVDAVARACAQAIEAFAVPGVPDAVGLRVYVPAAGIGCGDRWDLRWGLGGYACVGKDWVIDYVAFVRGQYHVSVAVGDAEDRPPELATQREAALDIAADAAQAACEVEVPAGVRRTCTPRR